MILTGALKNAGVDGLKGIGAAAFSFLGLALGGLFVRTVLGLPQVSIPPQADMRILVPLMMLTVLLVSILLGECFQRLYFRFWQRLVCIWLCMYLLYYLLNLLDGMLFSPLQNMSTGAVSELFPALFAAAAIALAWRPKRGAEQPGRYLKTFLASRKRLELAWRLALAWLIYPPLYYLIGRGAAVFTLHYYEDPNLGLGLTLPPVGLLMGMQVLRGALFLLAVLPILAAWRGSRRGLWLWVTAVIYCQIAGTTILQAYWLPLALRIPHLLELLIDSAVQAFVYVVLLTGSTLRVPEKDARPALLRQRPEVMRPNNQGTGIEPHEKEVQVPKGRLAEEEKRTPGTADDRCPNPRPFREARSRLERRVGR